MFQMEQQTRVRTRVCSVIMLERQIPQQWRL